MPVNSAGVAVAEGLVDGVSGTGKIWMPGTPSTRSANATALGVNATSTTISTRRVAATGRGEGPRGSLDHHGARPRATIRARTSGQRSRVG